ncbi:transcriptional regulator [Halorubrum sp. Atlit-26R]|nr:transcriptional regulator [Halorubrum sp. Atlit-26R]
MNDTAFDALANEHRRELLLDLLDENPQEVAVELPAGDDAGEPNTTHHRRIEMYHIHLPKLDDYGFIQWDRDTHEVTKGPRFEELRPLLECMVEHAQKPISSRN